MKLPGMPFKHDQSVCVMKWSLFCHSDDPACSIWAGCQLAVLPESHVWLFKYHFMLYSYGSKAWQINIHMMIMLKIIMRIITSLQWCVCKGDISINVTSTMNFSAFAAEMWIFVWKWIDTMSSDVLAPGVARTSAIIVLFLNNSAPEGLACCGTVTPHSSADLGQHALAALSRLPNHWWLTHWWHTHVIKIANDHNH